MTRIRTAFSGWKGRMGAVVVPALERASDVELVAKVEAGDDLVALCRAARAEVVVDFTTPAAAAGNARRILDAGCHGVIGTTGFTEADLVELDGRAKAAGKALLVAPNFALGVLLMLRFAAQAARWFPRSEIVEVHHDGKQDAPSGTALRTADVLRAARDPAAASTKGGRGGGDDDPSRGLDRDGIRVHAVRLPGFLAHQEVFFGGAGEALSIRHDAFSRECYVPGVLLGVRAVRGRVGVLRGLETVMPPAS